MLTPARRRGVELLDDPAVDPEVRFKAQRDVARSNRLLGGLRAAVIELRDLVRLHAESPTLLDVGTGVADIPARAAAMASAAGVTLTTIGLDGAPSLLVSARGSVTYGVCASAFALPFRDHSIDIVMCSQLLHHFDWADAEHVVRELDRVATHGVVISDLRRSWFAAIGFWIVASLLGYHRVVRHDGVVSVLRGFTGSELRRVVTNATGITPRVRHRLGYRLTARWTPRTNASPATA
jgi:SAM-dependent methyltransferase